MKDEGGTAGTVESKMNYEDTGRAGELENGGGE
jgi:hypothetical protein